MKQKRNSIVRYLVVILLAAVFAAYSFGSATVSALGSNVTETQFAVSIWGEDGSGNPCDWDNSEQCARAWDVDDSKAESCTGKGSGYSWFACTISKHASGASVVLYSLMKDRLATDPKIFDNTAMKEGWKTMRNLANLVVVIMLIVTIMSQVTGVGISNYGIKKALPRIVVVVLLINLSYFICRIAIDLMNISAEAIQNVFEPLTSVARAKIHYDPGSVFASMMGSGTESAITVALAYFGTKSFLASGESALLLFLGLVVTIAIAIILFLVTIFVRGALVVLLTITAPVAVLLAIFPGTKKTFNTWFNMFKGVLLCYPMAAMLVYGGGFAGTIAMAALGVNSITLLGVDLPVNIFTLIVSVAASIAPMAILPGMIVKSTGAIGATLQGFANRLTGMINGGTRGQKLGGIRGSAMGQKLQRSAMDRRNRLIAGVDGNGNQRKGFLASRMRSGSAEERMAAESALAGSRAKQRAEENALAQEESGDTEIQDLASKEKFDQLQASNVDAKDEDVEKTFDEIFENADLSNLDSLVGQIDGSIKHFSRVNPKNGAETILMRKLDALQDQASGANPKYTAADVQRMREAIAKSRLSSKSFNKSKMPVEYAAYKAIAAGDTNKFLDSTGKNMDNQWVAKMISSPEFSADALSNYAPPSINAISNFMNDDANEQASYYPADSTNPNAQQERLDETMEAKRRVRQAYDQMIQTSSYRQNAAAGDFSGIVKAIRSGKGA